PAEAEALQHLARGVLPFADGDALAYLGDGLQGPRLRVQLREVLREVGQVDGGPVAHGPGVRGLLFREQAEQARLPRAVDPDHADTVPGPELPGEAVQQDGVASPEGDVFDVDDGLAQPGAGEPDQFDGVAGGRLVGDERVRRFDPE